MTAVNFPGAYSWTRGVITVYTFFGVYTINRLLHERTSRYVNISININSSVVQVHIRHTWYITPVKQTTGDCCFCCFYNISWKMLAVSAVGL